MAKGFSIQIGFGNSGSCWKTSCVGYIHRYFRPHQAVIKTPVFPDSAHPNNVESNHKKMCYHSNESIFCVQLKCNTKPWTVKCESKIGCRHWLVLQLPGSHLSRDVSRRSQLYTQGTASRSKPLALKEVFAVRPADPQATHCALPMSSFSPSCKTLCVWMTF